MKTENKTQVAAKIVGNAYKPRDAFSVPNPEAGKKYCWARYSQVVGKDGNPLPEGWRPVNRNLSDTGAGGEQRGTDGKVESGDMVLCEISDEDYARNQAAKRALSKNRVNMVKMRPEKNRYYTVESELKQEVVSVTKNNN